MRDGDALEARRSALLHHLGPLGGSAGLLAGAYVLVRWFPSPARWSGAWVTAGVILLGVAAYRGVRRGHVAPYVVTALVLPTVLTAVLGLAAVQRVEAEVRDLLGGFFPLLPPAGDGP